VVDCPILFTSGSHQDHLLVKTFHQKKPCELKCNHFGNSWNNIIFFWASCNRSIRPIIPYGIDNQLVHQYNSSFVHSLGCPAFNHCWGYNKVPIL
jgi:hypothetical protein